MLVLKCGGSFNHTDICKGEESGKIITTYFKIFNMKFSTVDNLLPQ